MSHLSPVFARRSIRKFQSRPVEEEKIEILLRAAMAAPSAHNQQPWAILVLDERETLDGISRVHPYAQMLRQAPLAFLVLGTMDKLKTELFWPQDCAAAVENVMVEAVNQGLGSCWMGVYPVQELQDALGALLSVPPNLMPFALIALGYPGEEKEPSKRFDPARVFRNRFPD